MDAITTYSRLGGRIRTFSCRAAGAESGFAHERVWAVEAVGQCASVVSSTDKQTLQGFVHAHADTDATIYTDDHKSYEGMAFDHEAVKHSIGEYVREQAHTNGVESFWELLKRGYNGTFHHVSAKHLHRYVNEFANRHNLREHDTEKMMQEIFASMLGKRLIYKDLIS